MKKLFTLITLSLICPSALFAAKYYMVGEDTGWESLEKYRFSGADGIYTLHVDELRSGYDHRFKIIVVGDDNEWTYYGIENETFEFDKPSACVVSSYGNDIHVPVVKENETTIVYGAILRFDVTDAANPKLTVVPDFYVVGEVNNWSNIEPAYRLAENNGIYSLNVKKLEGEFRIAAGIRPDWIIQYGAGETLSFGNTVDCDLCDKNLTMADGCTENVVLKFDKASKRLTAISPAQADDNKPVYIINNANEWNTVDAYRFSTRNGIYSIHVDELRSGDDNRFKIVRVVDGEWTRYGLASETIEFDTAQPLVVAEGTSGDIHIPVQKADEETAVSGATIIVDFSDESNPTMTVVPDLYIVGEVNNWNNGNYDYRMTERDGIYSSVISSLEGGFKIAAGIYPEWTFEYGGDSTLSFGSSVNVAEGPSAGNLSMADGNTSDIVLRFDKAARVLKANGLKSEIKSSNLYLAGAVNSWASDNNDYKFNESDGVYTLTTSGLTDEFKIVSDDWTFQFGCAEPISYGVSYKSVIANNGSNLQLLDVSGQEVYITFNSNDMTIKVDAKDPSLGTQRPTLYVRGLDGNWDTCDDSNRMADNGGVYTLHVDKLVSNNSYRFKICSEDYKYQFGTAASFSYDMPMACVNGHGNDIQIPALKDGVETTLNGATLTLDYRNPAKPTLTINPDLYLTGGDITNWSNTNADYRFSLENGNYVLRASDISGEFKIAEGFTPDWRQQYGGPTAMSNGQTYTLSETGGNMTLGSQSGITELTFDKSTKQLTIGSVAGSVQGKEFYLAGSINGWASDNNDYKFTENNGIYTLNIGRLTGEFKIVTKDWAYQFGTSSIINYGQPYSLVFATNGNNMMLEEAVGQNVTIVFDSRNMTVEVTGIDTLYLVGAFNDWAVSEIYAFSHENGVYTLTTGDFSGEFKIVNRDWTTQLGSNSPNPFDLDHHYALKEADPKGDNITFNGLPSRAASRVRLTLIADGTPDPDDNPTTGIESIAPDQSQQPVEYYNLQGIRVDRPANGIYVRRQGDRVEKVYVK